MEIIFKDGPVSITWELDIDSLLTKPLSSAEQAKLEAMIREQLSMIVEGEVMLVHGALNGLSILPVVMHIWASHMADVSHTAQEYVARILNGDDPRRIWVEYFEGKRPLNENPFSSFINGLDL